MQKRKLPIKILTLASAIATANVLAQQEAGSTLMEEVVVTSSRVPIPLSRIATSVSIINATDIQAHGNLALTDVLRQFPAVAISSNGGAGKPASMRIRGEEGYRTLTIMDGIRLSDPSTPQIGPAVEYLLSSGINRVEILRGPQGLSYGADAGGIVNISSRQADNGFQASLDAQTGEYATQQYSANAGGANSRADFFVAVADLATDGFNSRTNDSVFQDKDGYENKSVHLRGGFNMNEQWRVELVHRDVDSESGYDGCFSATMNGNDCIALYEQSAARAALDYTGANFSHSFSYNSTDTDRDLLSSGVSSFAATGELQRWEYLGTATGLPGFDLVFGADMEEALNDGKGRDNTGIHLEYLSDFSDDLHITAGARHDDNDDFGTNTSYRISGAYLINLADGSLLKFKSSYGTGFRAPSPYEIAYNSGSFAYPPASLASLQQETSKGREAGVEYVRGNSLQLEAVYFDQDVEDAIYFDLDTFSGYLQDFGRSTSKGLELSGALTINQNWRLRANYTWNDTQRPNGVPRIRRPQNLGNLGVSWYGMDQRLNLNGFYRMSRNSIDEAGAAMVPLDDFGVLDITANFSITDTIRIYGRLENALDEDYQEVAGYNTAGRAAYVGFRLSYGGF